MIEIKQDGKSVSVTGSGNVVDLMASYTIITYTVGMAALEMTGTKEVTDGLMRRAWDAVRKDVFGEERDDA